MYPERYLPYSKMCPTFCRICGSLIKNTDSAMKFREKHLCSTCISEISVRELLRICEFSSKEELLYYIGFTRI